MILLSGTFVPLDDEASAKALAERRLVQHQKNSKFQQKTKPALPEETFDKGQLTMFRDVNNYDKPRDTFIVVGNNEEGV